MSTEEVETDLSIREIYNTLFAGAKLVMTFPNPAELMRFKTRLHQMKRSQEKPAVELGMMEEGEIQMLSFIPLQDGSYKIMLTGKKELKKYTVKILEEEDIPEQQQEESKKSA